MRNSLSLKARSYHKPIRPQLTMLVLCLVFTAIAMLCDYMYSEGQRNPIEVSLTTAMEQWQRDDAAIKAKLHKHSRHKDEFSIVDGK